MLIVGYNFWNAVHHTFYKARWDNMSVSRKGRHHKYEKNVLKQKSRQTVHRHTQAHRLLPLTHRPPIIISKVTSRPHNKISRISVRGMKFILKEPATGVSTLYIWGCRTLWGLQRLYLCHWSEAIYLPVCGSSEECVYCSAKTNLHRSWNMQSFNKYTIL